MQQDYYLDVATLIKMTSFFETKLEARRKQIAQMLLFHPSVVYNELADGIHGISTQTIKNLGLQFMDHITEEEAHYLLQIYSSDHRNMSYEDLVEVLTPKTFKSFKFQTIDHEIKSGVVFDCVRAFWSILKIELQYFRQAEPLRGQMITKHKEEGDKLGRKLSSDSDKITDSTILTLCLKQRYQFTTDDVLAFFSRVAPLSTDGTYVTFEQFYKNCLFVPFRIQNMRNPAYKLIKTSEKQPEKQTAIALQPQNQDITTTHPYFYNSQSETPKLQNMDMQITQDAFDPPHIAQNKVVKQAQQSEALSFKNRNIFTTSQVKPEHQKTESEGNKKEETKKKEDSKKDLILIEEQKPMEIKTQQSPTDFNRNFSASQSSKKAPLEAPRRPSIPENTNQLTSLQQSTNIVQSAGVNYPNYYERAHEQDRRSIDSSRSNFELLTEGLQRKKASVPIISYNMLDLYDLKKPEAPQKQLLISTQRKPSEIVIPQVSVPASSRMRAQIFDRRPSEVQHPDDSKILKALLGSQSQTNHKGAVSQHEYVSNPEHQTYGNVVQAHQPKFKPYQSEYKRQMPKSRNHQHRTGSQAQN